MIRFFFEKLHIKSASRGHRGFSLVETLMTVVMLLIVSSMALTALQFGTVEYRKSMNQSLAQTFYSTMEAALESRLQYSNDSPSDYELRDGILYLRSGEDWKPVLDPVAYTGLKMDDFSLTYSGNCYRVAFSVCDNTNVLIDGHKYSFDVFSLRNMLGFNEAAGEDTPDAPVVPPATIHLAQAMITVLNQNIYSADPSFEWADKPKWNEGALASRPVQNIGKALVSGAKGQILSDAFAALGYMEAAAKYSTLLQTIPNAKGPLGNHLVNQSSYYTSIGGGAILVQTKENITGFAKNSSYEVIMYYVAECKKNGKFIKYDIIGIRETVIQTNSSSNIVLNEDDYDIKQWTVVPYSGS